MKLTILRHELNEAIQNVSKAVSSRTTIPILSGIKIDATFTGVTLTASDTDISIQSFVPLETADKRIATVERTGSVVLPAKFFVEMVKKLPHEEVHLEVGERFQTMIRSGSTDIQLAGLDPEEFPVMPTVAEDQIISVPGDLLREMIRQTVFAVTTNESSPILTGVLWNLQDGSFKFVATDRHRLASRTAPVESGDVRFSNVVISGKTLSELAKIVPDQNVLVDIVVAESQVLFKLGNVLFFSRMLDGTYPDTSKIIPQTFKTELVLNTKMLSDAIDRAYLLSREEKTNIVRLSTMEDGSIEISSSSSELGRVTEQLEAVQLNGDPLRIAFNSKYMLDALKVIDSEELFIGFTGAMSPIIIKPRDHDHSLHLILPYRTTN
ncbi:DNA polymerase III subunit beta [Cohnella sp. CFH 77786]|uniref:DNA polymerase III subunit beta n=1 Tax=Cohnella sp. CFH 77786 TaxID=2662265 RepID=UPI001C60AAF4|nr:DNA polymerase III subunit beta [Cohnella sp. CFH 77786]MBW5448807.1 DNA polymerase III subunit beta [Cohnella sp. CFH 77786]